MLKYVQTNSIVEKFMQVIDKSNINCRRKLKNGFSIKRLEKVSNIKNLRF